jgi:hypothetical protein
MNKSLKWLDVLMYYYCALLLLLLLLGHVSIHLNISPIKQICQLTLTGNKQV